MLPAVNQIELHPTFTQAELREVHAADGHRHRGVGADRARATSSTTPPSARSPSGSGKTPAQVIIRWHLQLGNIVFPKSVTPSRIEENFDVFDFELEDSDVASISALDAGNRTGPDPDDIN